VTVDALHEAEDVRRPLAGLRVLDLTQVVSGAFTTMLLADFGAEVIKVEPPSGEPYRINGYEIENELGSINLNILRYSRGKKSVVIDLKSDDGKQLFRRLVEESDILVENFRAGVLARLGFGRPELESINPTLIYTTVTGFGHEDLFESPYRARPAYAMIVESMAGLMHLAGSGGKPTWLGFAMADIFAGALAFAGTLLALLDRQAGDRGRRVDIAMYDGAVLMNDLAVTLQTVIGETLGPGQYLLQSPWGPFEVSDGHIVIAVMTGAQWRATCEVIGRPDLAVDDRLQTGFDRSRHHEDIVAPAIRDWCATLTKDACANVLLAAGIPAAPVNTSEDVVACPQVHARNMLVDVSAPVLGQVRLVGNPIKLDGRPADGAATRVPQLGEHTATVLRDVLGLSEQAIASLAGEGTVAYPQCRI